MMQIMRMQAHIAAIQTQAMLLPFQMWSRFFNPLAAFDETKVAVSGLDALTRLNPWLRDFTARLPGEVEVTFDSAPGKPEVEAARDHKKLKLRLSLTEPHRNWLALAELFNMAAKDYPKPDFRIDEASILGETHKVRQSVLLDKPFASLRLFETGHKGPLLYIAPPISGHYSTLVRETIQSALNAGFRVAVYDIKNARDVPRNIPDMGMDECVAYHEEFIGHLGGHIDPRVNVQAVCQATVPVSRAAANLAKKGSPFTPFTLDLDAGPVNPHASMTEVTEFSQKHNLNWFRQNVISRVPAQFKGAGRDVYGAFRQIGAFMGMNPGAHAGSFAEIFNHVVDGTKDSDGYKKKQVFYEEYLSGADLPMKLYMDTIRHFREGNKADLSAYKGYLLTKEASEDDISAPGQTMYAHEMMPGAKGYHYTLEGAGHYGIFAGSKARDRALPVMFAFIHKALRENGFDYGPVLDSYGNAMDNPQMPEAYSRDKLDETVIRQAAAWEEFKLKRTQPANDALQFSVTMPLPGFQTA